MNSALSREWAVPTTSHHHHSTAYHNSRTPQEALHTLQTAHLGPCSCPVWMCSSQRPWLFYMWEQGNTAVCCLQLRSQATFQAATQFFALISIEFTWSALQNTGFFAVGLSCFSPPFQGTKEAYHQKKTDLDISSLLNLLEAMQTTALTLEAVKTKSHLISFPAWVSD